MAMQTAFQKTINYRLYVFVKSAFGSKCFGVFNYRRFAFEYKSECAHNFLLLLLIETCAKQTAFVNNSDFRRIMTADNTERRNIVIDTGQRC